MMRSTVFEDKDDEDYEKHEIIDPDKALGQQPESEEPAEFEDVQLRSEEEEMEHDGWSLVADDPEYAEISDEEQDTAPVMLRNSDEIQSEPPSSSTACLKQSLANTYTTAKSSIGKLSNSVENLRQKSRGEKLRLAANTASTVSRTGASVVRTGWAVFKDGLNYPDRIGEWIGGMVLEKGPVDDKKEEEEEEDDMDEEVLKKRLEEEERKKGTDG